jgi:hypothetical protein
MTEGEPRVKAPSSLQIAPVRKTLVVQATAKKAFDVFTAGIDRWWPKTHGIGAAPLRESIIEPFVGGRWYSRHADGAEAVVGHVLVWEPAQRFVCSWEISADWKPDARAAFASEVEHRKFERMAPPGGEKMRNDVDGGWVKILEFFAEELSKEGSPI